MRMELLRLAWRSHNRMKGRFVAERLGGLLRFYYREVAEVGG